MQVSALEGIKQEQTFLANIHGTKLKPSSFEYTRKLDGVPDPDEKQQKTMGDVMDSYLKNNVQKRLQYNKGRLN